MLILMYPSYIRIKVTGGHYTFYEEYNIPVYQVNEFVLYNFKAQLSNSCKHVKYKSLGAPNIT